MAEDHYNPEFTYNPNLENQYINTPKFEFNYSANNSKNKTTQDVEMPMCLSANGTQGMSFCGSQAQQTTNCEGN